MSLPTYSGARSTLKTALSSAVSGWDIFEAPRLKMTTRTISMTIRGSDRRAANRWVRELIVGVFVPSKNIDEALDALESVTPDIYTAVTAVGGTTVQVDPPEAVTVAGDDYIAQFHLIELETTS
ncbi:MAG: hypothetical protein DWP92_01665 [Armatimonadetes bacterium]|nr:MAG: hypothetical protein DWP92_01665 [Armatimonadota bacterium]